jgi:hypothetical protein
MAFNFENYHHAPTGIIIEPFYISPDNPLITIKQAHIIKNYINLNYNKDFIIKNFSNDGNFNADLFFKLVRTLVYPYWNDATYTIGKGHPVFAEKYGWAWQDNNEVSQAWLKTISWLGQSMDEYFLNSGNINNGLKGCWSRRYKLNV